MKKRFLATVMAVILGASALAGCGNDSGGNSGTNAGSADTEESADAKGDREVRIAIQPSAAFIPLYVARESGWIEEALSDLGVTVTWNDFESGPPMNESLSSGASDIGVMGDVPTVSGIAAGQESEIVAIAADGPLSYAMLVSKDSDLESPADLAGKTIGVTLGSTGHNLADKLLTKAGLDINSDVELVNIATGDAASVLSTGEVDAVCIWEPNVTRLVEDGTAKIIGDGSECGLLGVNPIIARAEYAQENADVIEAIIEQYARAAASLDNLDDDVKAKVSDYLSLEPDQLSKVIEKYEYNVVFSDADTENLQDTISFLVKIGNLEEEYDIEPYVKKEYTENADISEYIK